MPTLPNPFESAAPHTRPADQVAASFDSTSCDVAAGPFQSAAVPFLDAPTTAAAGANAGGAFLDDTGDIHEIFYHARKLVADDHRFVLDEITFMEAIEPPPLFLQRRA